MIAWVLFNFGFATSLLFQLALVFNATGQMSRPPRVRHVVQLRLEIYPAHPLRAQRMGRHYPGAVERRRELFDHRQGSCTVENYVHGWEVGGFCALVEVMTNAGGAGGKAQNEKGWGMFVTPARMRWQCGGSALDAGLRRDCLRGLANADQSTQPLHLDTDAGKAHAA